VGGLPAKQEGGSALQISKFHFFPMNVSSASICKQLAGKAKGGWPWAVTLVLLSISQPRLHTAQRTRGLQWQSPFWCPLTLHARSSPETLLPGHPLRAISIFQRHITFDLVMPPLGIYPRDTLACHEDLCTGQITAAFSEGPKAGDTPLGRGWLRSSIQWNMRK